MSKVLYNPNLKKHARELRNNSTLGEVILWKKVLRAKNVFNYQFNRQFPIENYIVDFISRKLKLIIEVDGYSHNFKHSEDKERDFKLSGLGFTVIRFSEHEIKYDLDNVVRSIENYVKEFEKINPPNPL